MTPSHARPQGARAAAAAAAPPAPAAAAAAEPSSEALRAERSDLKAKPAESAAEVKLGLALVRFRSLGLS